MTQVAETTKPVISQTVLELSERISANLTMDKATGVAAVDAKTYVNLLPEGLTEETVKSVQQHTMNMAAASLHALGNAAVPVFKSNADLAGVTLSVPMVGKDSIELSMDRSRQVPGRDEAGNPTTNTSWGPTQVKIDTYGVGKRGDMAKIKKELSEMAQAAFGK